MEKMIFCMKHRPQYLFNCLTSVTELVVNIFIPNILILKGYYILRSVISSERVKGAE